MQVDRELHKKIPNNSVSTPVIEKMEYVLGQLERVKGSNNLIVSYLSESLEGNKTYDTTTPRKLSEIFLESARLEKEIAELNLENVKIENEIEKKSENLKVYKRKVTVQDPPKYDKIEKAMKKDWTMICSEFNKIISDKRSTSITKGTFKGLMEIVHQSKTREEMLDSYEKLNIQINKYKALLKN